MTPSSLLRVAFVCLLLSTAPLVASDLDDLRAADLRRVTALIRADKATLESVLADDLSYGHADGRVQTKADLLAALASGAVTYESYDGPPPAARTEGGVGILAGTAELRASAKGQSVRLRLRYLAVYARRDGAWKLIAYQSTRMDEPPSTGR